MKVNNILPFLCVTFLQFCSGQKYQEQATMRKESALAGFGIRDWQLSLNTSDSISWGFSAQYIRGENNLIVVENGAMKRIEVYDFNQNLKKAHIEKLKLDIKGFGDVNGLSMLGEDSVLIQQEYRITLWMPLSGELKTLLKLNENRDSRQWVSSLQYAPPYYDSRQKRVYLRQYAVKCKDPSREFYSTPLEISVGTADQNIKTSPVKYSSLYRKGYYGFANFVYRVCNDSFNIFSFPADPNLYVFNRYSNGVSVVGARSRWHTNMANTLPGKSNLDTERKVKHATEMPFYDEVKYDFYRNLYYRFFAREMPLKNRDGTYNTWEDKRYTLIVMNRNFEVIEEIDLQNYWINPFVTFIAEDGICIKVLDNLNNKKEGNTKFIKIHFKKAYG